MRKLIRSVTSFHFFRKGIAWLVLGVASLLVFRCHPIDETSLTPETFAQIIATNPDVVILDVRSPEEFSNGHIKNAANIDFNSAEFSAKIEAMDKSRPYLVYCLSGGRSADAVLVLKQRGFEKVYNLNGGLLAWQRSNYSLTGDSFNEPQEDLISMEEYSGIIHSEPLVLVDFYAPWCGPCKKMEPMLSELQEDIIGVKVFRLNIEENKHLAHSLGVTEIPILKLFKAGKMVWVHHGLIEKPALTKAISNI